MLPKWEREGGENLTLNLIKKFYSFKFFFDTFSSDFECFPNERERGENLS